MITITRNHGFRGSSPKQRFTGGLILLVTLTVAYQLLIYTYNVYFHPLRHFPGPRLAAASALPRIRAALRGDGVSWIVDLHRRYGEIVRVSPNELSFSGADAWKDIYKRSGQSTLVKDPAFYLTPNQTTYHIVNADREDHTRQRRIFANAFSDGALKKQEPLFLTHINKLIHKLRSTTSTNPLEKCNMVDMYNFGDYSAHAVWTNPLSY